jgi:hypothetical protein
MAASDLTTLAAVKAWLSITNTNSDALLIPLITAASRLLYGYMGRGAILPQQWTERSDGIGYPQNRIYLRQYPVTSIASLVINNVAIPASPAPAAGSTASASGFLLQPWDGTPPGGIQALDLFAHSIPRGRQNIVVTYVAGYQAVGEAQVVPVNPGPYTIVAASILAQPYGAFTSDQGVAYANGTALTKVIGVPTIGQYAFASGTYTFAAADQGAAILVSYGFIPQDLAQACIELVAERYKYKDRIGEKSKSLGGQESVSFDLKSITDATKLIIQPYRRVVPM